MTVMSVEAAVEPATAKPAARKSDFARFARPMLGLLVPLVLAGGWELAVYLGFSNGRLVPPPSRIYAEFAELARSGELTRHVTATLLRVGAGFAAGTVVATVLGALAGYSTLVRRLIDPSLQGLRAVPSIAWIPLFILWLGIFETSKIALIRSACSSPFTSASWVRSCRSTARSSKSGASFGCPARRWCGGSFCPRSCPLTCLRCAPVWGSAGCSLSPPNSWVPPKDSAIC